MGGHSDNSGADQANSLTEQQIELNKQEIAAKTQSLFESEMGIIKGTGGQDFGNNPAVPHYTPASYVPPKRPFPGGGQ